MSQKTNQQAGERKRVKSCDECGEEHNGKHAQCPNCFTAMAENFGEDEMLNDPGYRPCNCEDYPCCEH